MQLLTVQTIRSDSQGNGHFGSGRNGHKHEGVDLVATKGEPVFAPADGTLVRVVKPYRSTAGAKSALNGFDFKTAEHNIRVFYAKPLETGKSYLKGQIIGYAESVQSYYTSAMTNHIHVEVRNTDNVLLDPTKLLENLKKK